MLEKRILLINQFRKVLAQGQMWEPFQSTMKLKMEGREDYFKNKITLARYLRKDFEESYRKEGFLGMPLDTLTVDPHA